MIVIMADDEYTTTEGDDFVILHKNSEFFPTGQNIDSPSIMVRGIVSDTSISNIARIDMSSSLVAFVDCCCILFRLLPIRLWATHTDAFDSREDIINTT